MCVYPKLLTLDKIGTDLDPYQVLLLGVPLLDTFTFPICPVDYCYNRGASVPVSKRVFYGGDYLSLPVVSTGEEVRRKHPKGMQMANK